VNPLVTRLGIAAAGVLLIATCLTIFLPEHSDAGSSCGHWFSPTYSADEGEKLIRESGILGPSARERLADELQECDNALDTRRAWSIGLGLGMIGVPLLIWWVGDGLGVRRREAS
jgi:hypothetical protein